MKAYLSHNELNAKTIFVPEKIFGVDLISPRVSGNDSACLEFISDNAVTPVLRAFFKNGIEGKSLKYYSFLTGGHTIETHQIKDINLDVHQRSKLEVFVLKALHLSKSSIRDSLYFYRLEPKDFNDLLKIEVLMENRLKAVRLFMQYGPLYDELYKAAKLISNGSRSS